MELEGGANSPSVSKSTEIFEDTSMTPNCRDSKFQEFPGDCDPSLSNMPEPPQEPLQSDCCGTGCTPCVFDIYQDDLKCWEALAKLSPEERAVKIQKPRASQTTEVLESALSVEEYREFEVLALKEVSSNCFLYTFGLPELCTLGVGIGQHATLQ